MKQESIDRVYLLGIGGIGMSAIARYYRFMGKRVEGYDRVCTPLTKELESEGIKVRYCDGVLDLPGADEVKHTLVVYTPAIPGSDSGFQYFKRNGFVMCKRSHVLSAITSEKKCIAIAGTHGKTSVTAMVSHLLKVSEIDCISFIGGVSKNYGTNLLLSNSDSRFIVVEADEFDKSFLQLRPDLAVVTSIDPDHLDIYGNAESLREAFRVFVSQVNEGGTVLVKKELGVFYDRREGVRFLTYSMLEDADFRASNIVIEGGTYQFDLSTPFGRLERLVLAYPGIMNVENAVAACGVAMLCGADEDGVRESLSTYEGVVRRFDMQYSGKGVVYIDDYAHHPKEIEATIKSVSALYPGRKITGIFQPHLFTRTRDFAEEFAFSLDMLDSAILLDIYPAREEPISGVSTGTIFEKMKIKSKQWCRKEDLLHVLDGLDIEVLLTLGAGDIGQLVELIKGYLTEKQLIE